MPKGRSRIAPRNPLPKNSACASCKARKVRCDGQLPCKACLRTTRHEGRDPSECKCYYLPVPPPLPKSQSPSTSHSHSHSQRRRRSATLEEDKDETASQTSTSTSTSGEAQVQVKEEMDLVEPPLLEPKEEVMLMSPPISPLLAPKKESELAHSTSYPTPLSSPASLPVPMPVPIGMANQFFLAPIPVVELAPPYPHHPYHVPYPSPHSHPADYIPHHHYYHHHPQQQQQGYDDSPHSTPELSFSPLGSPALPSYSHPHEAYSPHYPSCDQLFWPLTPPTSNSSLSPGKPSPFANSSHKKDLLNTLAPPLKSIASLEFGEDAWSMNETYEEMEGDEGHRVDYATFLVGQGIDWRRELF